MDKDTHLEIIQQRSPRISITVAACGKYNPAKHTRNRENVTCSECIQWWDDNPLHHMNYR